MTASLRLRIENLLRESGVKAEDARRIVAEAEDLFASRPALRRHLIREFKLWAPLPIENMAWHEGRRSALLYLLQLSGLTAAELLESSHDRND